jgi:hypothetical protein
MDKITSIDFYNSWVETVNNRKEELLKIWSNSKLFTKYIKGDDNCIIDEVANKLGLLSYPNDYYSIDAVLYKQEDKVPGTNPNNFWFRDLRVAFEHENNFNSGLYKEVSHLLIANCDLRVLVTYPNSGIDKELKVLHNIISGNRNSKLISNEKNFLIILGYENGFKWEGYFYTEEKWVQI